LRTQGVNYACHGSIIVFSLFLDRGVSDVKFELGCGVAFALGKSCFTFGFGDGIEG
jgi:hypothetical protein